MLNIQLIAVAVRLFAVWLAVWGLRNVPAFWLFNLHSVSDEQRIYALAVSILMLVVAISLWFFPITVAGKLISGRRSMDYPALSGKQFQRIGASLIGLWVLTDTVPNAGYAIVALSMRSTPLDGSGYATIVRIVIEMIIGIWLLFGAPGVSSVSK